MKVKHFESRDIIFSSRDFLFLYKKKEKMKGKVPGIFSFCLGRLFWSLEFSYFDISFQTKRLMTESR